MDTQDKQSHQPMSKIHPSLRPRANKSKRQSKGTKPPTGKVRLQKFLAEAGIAARRKCEEMIVEGLVEVNGKVVESLPAFVEPAKDTVKVNGQKVRMPQRVYFLLNKPKNVICSNSDPQGRKRAIDLVDTPFRVVCVGRLDTETSGAIILTNDSELVNRMTHPRYELPRTYEIRIRGSMDDVAIERFKQGSWLSGGKGGRAEVRVIRRNNVETMLEVTIQGGLHSELRLVMHRVGFKVLSIRRTRIGTITLKDTPLGCSRPLTKAQVDYLKKSTGMPIE
ncbi:MAG: rRNA pseudouridine synthase [Phycisphaerae bacterium]|nr:rRNA pseudouridine synthase [Phycisphaerae bacterium]